MATYIRGKNPNKRHTIRYYYEGKQHEKSFKYKRDADDFKAKFEHDSRERIFVDPKTANEPFASVAGSWLARHPGKDKTKQNYEMLLRLHILPVFGGQGLAAVARDREGAERFLRETLPGKGLGPSMAHSCRLVLNAIVNDAIKAGKLNQTRLRGIKLPALPQKTEIPFASHEQIEKMALEMPAPYGFTVYLMRGCGLRLGEALGVAADDIAATVLRLSCQLAPDGSSRIPLKHRDGDAYRDIPVPKYVLDARPDAFVMSMNGFPSISHRQYRDYFNRARDKAGLPDTLTPHTLRHIFASVCLAGGIPITDVSKWLGHRSIEVTYQIYGHLVPASWDRARGVLDEEWKA